MAYQLAPGECARTLANAVSGHRPTTIYHLPSTDSHLPCSTGHRRRVMAQGQGWRHRAGAIARIGADAPLVPAGRIAHFLLARLRFVWQSARMEHDAAAEHLQVIRTLMERSALYRRTLAPIMLLVGSVGVLAAVGAIALGVDRSRAFCGWWLAAAVVALAGAL